MHQTIPMLSSIKDVDGGFAHRSDFCGHFGAAWHKEVALFEFLPTAGKDQNQANGHVTWQSRCSRVSTAKLAGLQPFLGG